MRGIGMSYSFPVERAIASELRRNMNSFIPVRMRRTRCGYIMDRELNKNDSVPQV